VTAEAVPDGRTDLVEVTVTPWTETLLTDVSTEVDDEERVYRLPAGLVEAYEHAVKTVYDLSGTIADYVEGRETAQEQSPRPAVAGVARPVFGDPRYCWNPVKHLPHDFAYQVGDRAGRYYCHGDGQMAAQILGIEQAQESHG
jgi:hypothetical protein